MSSLTTVDAETLSDSSQAFTGAEPGPAQLHRLIRSGHDEWGTGGGD